MAKEIKNRKAMTKQSTKRAKTAEKRVEYESFQEVDATQNGKLKLKKEKKQGKLIKRTSLLEIAASKKKKKSKFDKLKLKAKSKGFSARVSDKHDKD